MKKVLFVFLLLFTSTTVTTFQSCSGAASALTSGNVSTVAQSILGILTPKLGLNTAQSPLVSKLLTTFLTNKSKFMGLMKTDPTAYTSKFGDAQRTLITGLQGVLNSGQMTNFMGLKPATNDAKNVLSNLFF